MVDGFLGENGIVEADSKKDWKSKNQRIGEILQRWQ